MPTNVLFKHAFIWGVGAAVGANLTRGTLALIKVMYNKTKRDKIPTE